MAARLVSCVVLDGNTVKDAGGVHWPGDVLRVSKAASERLERLGAAAPTKAARNNQRRKPREQ